MKSDRLFPQNYGVVGNYMPEGFVRQQLFPFQRLLAARKLSLSLTRR